MSTRGQDHGGNEPGPQGLTRARRLHPVPDLFTAAELGAQATWTVVAPLDLALWNGPCRYALYYGAPCRAGGAQQGQSGPGPMPIPGAAASNPPSPWGEPLTSVLATPAVMWGGCRLPPCGSRHRGRVSVSVQEGVRAAWLWPSAAGPAPVVTCFRGLWPADSGVAGSKRELLLREHSAWDCYGPALRSARQRKHAMAFLVFAIPGCHFCSAVRRLRFKQKRMPSSETYSEECQESVVADIHKRRDTQWPHSPSQQTRVPAPTCRRGLTWARVTCSWSLQARPPMVLRRPLVAGPGTARAVWGRPAGLVLT